MPIALRYPLVEMVTAGCYLLAWGRFGLPLAPFFWLFLSLLIAASFIDFDHLIIPDEITLGGTAAGLVCSACIPPLVGASVWWQGFLLSLFGAAAGFFLLWGVVELGKVTFGRKRIKPQLPSTVLALELA
jgi:leader peptidase (prepilin peptidase)/N-methyltransferase